MKKIILISILILMLVGVVSAATVTRSIVTSQPISPSSPFIVRYTVSGASTDYGVSVDESVTGGCTPISKRFVITSNTGTKQAPDESCQSPCDITYTSRSTDGTCTFSSSSDYQFDTQSIVTFGSTLQVTVGMVSACSSGADTSGNDVVDWTEINNAIGNWLVGAYSWTGINNAIGEWLNGC